MAKLDKIALSVVAIGAAILVFYLLSPTSSRFGRPVWPGSKDIDRDRKAFSLDHDVTKRWIAPSPEATEVISLSGWYGNGWAEENILVEKLPNQIRLRAWWITPYNDDWLLDTRLSQSDLEGLWNTLEDHRAFALKDESLAMSHAMTYLLTVRKGEQEHTAKVYGVGWYSSTTISSGGPAISPEWYVIVPAILNLRATHAHLIRPAVIQLHSSEVWLGSTTGEVLLQEIAEQQVAILKKQTRPVGQNELNWETVLDVGYYRNREIVEAVVSLLDAPDSNVAAAACAVMSWVSGEAPSADREHWKQWWMKNSATYRPSGLGPVDDASGNESIRTLGGNAKGFVGVEIDDEDSVWALIEIRRDWDRQTYRLYELDRPSDTFAATKLTRTYASKGGQPPPTRFFRLVAQSGLAFPVTYDHAWVSRDSMWGGATLRLNSKVLIDFASAKMIDRPFRSGPQYFSQVLSHDGSYMVVNKDWRRDGPNTLYSIEVSTGREQHMQIEAARTLKPIAYVARSASSSGEFLLLRERSDAPGVIWCCNEDGSNARVVFELPMGIRVPHRAMVTLDGSHLFVSQPTSEGHGTEHGWLSMTDGKFERVVPPQMWPGSVDANRGGSRVVFVDHGKVYEWRRPDASR